MTSERYVLKHFYYGQFVRDGKPAGDMRLLAKTHGVSDETIKEALQLALVPPMPGDNAGAWGVLRGKRHIPFMLVESEKGADGQLMLHYVLIPSEALRQLGGNLRLLHPFIEGDMPAYDKVGNIINPLVLNNIIPPGESQEVDDILDFMMFVKNRMNVIEALLAAVVKAIPIYVTSAPAEPLDRELFVNGLMMLLPPSVRFAVTFVTYSHPETNVQVQIRFVEDGDIPEKALQFDWKSGKVSGHVVEEGYSKFIVSQLRLDAELVIRQTRDLTTIANWRMRQTNSRLADALAYASQRVSVDDAVQNRQPIEAELVSRILSEDPTLSDEMRVAYARHLMSFSVALGELEHAEPLGIMLGGNEELADTAYDMLQQALRNGAAGDIFDLMSKWLNSPSGPQGSRWIEFTHQCARIYLNDIIDQGDLDEVDLFLKDVDRAGVTVVADKLLPELIQIAMPVAIMNTRLAQTVLIIACKYASHTALFEMLNNKAFLDHMPDETRQFIRAVRAKRPSGKLLLAAAASFETAQRLIMVRFVEIALKHDLQAMVDTPVLKQLVRVALADWSSSHTNTLNQVVQTLSEESVLLSRSDEDGQHVLAILLAMQSYDALTHRILEQSRLKYVGDRQTDFAVMVGQVFAETPIPEDEIPVALKAMQAGGIRSLPLALAYIGTLESHEPSDISNQVADDISNMLDNNPNLVDVLPMDAMITLIQFQLKRQHEDGILRNVFLLPVVAARYNERATGLIAKIYQRLDFSEVARAARSDLLRRYIRFMQRDAARNAVDVLGQNLGGDVQPMLEATYAMKLLMDDRSIVSYAEDLKRLASFLYDVTSAYASRNVPTQGAILNDLDSMPGGLSRDDKLKIAHDLIAAGRAAYELAETHNNVRGSDSDRRIEGLLKGTENPQTALEIMRVMGGFLAQGKRFELKLNTSQSSPHPLPGRSTGVLKAETETAQMLLRGMQASLPARTSQSVLARFVREELESIWNTLPKQTQRDLLQPLARDLQRVAELIPLMISRGDIRALEDSGQGRRLEENKVRPRNAMELFRFTAGYYLLRA